LFIFEFHYRFNRIEGGDSLNNQVFLSYARDDEEVANRLYSDLTRRGIKIWFDKYSLKPGQNWKLEIKKIITECKYFLAILSTSSVNRKGYVQKELKIALDVLDLFPDNEIFILPIRVDNCKPSYDKLHDLQWVDLFPDSKYGEGLRKILGVINPKLSCFRSHSRELDFEEVARIILENDYYESIINSGGKGIPHDYILKSIDGDEVVYDKMTGLMWIRTGTDFGRRGLYFSHEDGEIWIQRFNQVPYAQRKDWRLPTLEEAMSLLEPKSIPHTETRGINYDTWFQRAIGQDHLKRDQIPVFGSVELYIDEIFGNQRSIITCDKLKDNAVFWGVDYEYGRCCYNLPNEKWNYKGNFKQGGDVRPVRIPEPQFLESHGII